MRPGGCLEGQGLGRLRVVAGLGASGEVRDRVWVRAQGRFRVRVRARARARVGVGVRA